MSGRLYGISDSQLRGALARARAGGAKEAPGEFDLNGLGDGDRAKALAEGERVCEPSAIVDLSRPPFPCSSDGLDLYTSRQAMKILGAHKGPQAPERKRNWVRSDGSVPPEEPSGA